LPHRKRFQKLGSLDKEALGQVKEAISGFSAQQILVSAGRRGPLVEGVGARPVFQRRPFHAIAPQSHRIPDAPQFYKQAGGPVEKRIDELMDRMPLKEKFRQLDVQSGATESMSKHSDATDAAQFDLQKDAARVRTPVRALKGFSRNHLYPGETRTVNFRVPQLKCGTRKKSRQSKAGNARFGWRILAGKFEGEIREI
jgi:Fibronectin type III-like domain